MPNARFHSVIYQLGRSALQLAVAGDMAAEYREFTRRDNTTYLWLSAERPVRRAMRAEIRRRALTAVWAILEARCLLRAHGPIA